MLLLEQEQERECRVVNGWIEILLQFVEVVSAGFTLRAQCQQAQPPAQPIAFGLCHGVTEGNGCPLWEGGMSQFAD